MWAHELNTNLLNGVVVNQVSKNGALCSNGIPKKKFVQVPKLEAIGARKANNNVNGFIPNGTSRSNKCQLDTKILDLNQEACDLKKLDNNSVEERFKGLKIHEVRSHWDSSSDHSNASTSSSGVQKQIKVPVLQKRGSVTGSVRSSGLGLQNQHFQVKQTTPDGLIQIQPLLSTVSSHQEFYQLDDLQFFYQTNILKVTLKNWIWNRPSYKVTFGTLNSLKGQQPSVQKNQQPFVQNIQQSSVPINPKSIRLYQEYPHGQVYINRQIQLELHRTLTSAYYKYFNEPRQAKVVKLAENGNIWLQVFPEFQDLILNFTDKVALPEPIGLMDLLKKSPSDLKKSLYLTPMEGSFRRIQIQQILYPQKKLVVKFIDLGGDAEEIRADFLYDCYQLDPNLANFPPLVIKCQIKGIVSLNVEEFDTESSPYVVQFVDQVTEGADCVQQVHLWDNRKRYVNKLVVENGTAVPEPPEELLAWYSHENYYVRSPSSS